MPARTSPGTPGVIQARLADLRFRKAILDRIIDLLELIQPSSAANHGLKLLKTRDRPGEVRRPFVGAA